MSPSFLVLAVWTAQLLHLSAGMVAYALGAVFVLGGVEFGVVEVLPDAGDGEGVGCYGYFEGAVHVGAEAEAGGWCCACGGGG